eukprot:20095-Heterococcus_DN1.PRE.1
MKLRAADVLCACRKPRVLWCVWHAVHPDKACALGGVALWYADACATSTSSSADCRMAAPQLIVD